MPRQDTPDEEVVLPMPGRTGVEHARPMLTVLENRLHQLALCRAKGANYFATPPVTKPFDPPLHGAEDFLRRAIGGMAEKLGWEHPSTLAALLDLARAQLEQGRPAEAAHAAGRAHGGLFARLGPCALLTTEAAEAWARALEQQVAPHLDAAAAGRLREPPPGPLPRFQVHGDAASARARHYSARLADAAAAAAESSSNANGSGSTGANGTNGFDAGEEAAAAARAMAAKAVALRRGVAAARAEQLGSLHAQTGAAAAALASALECRAACFELLFNRSTGSRVGASPAGAATDVGGRRSLHGSPTGASASPHAASAHSASALSAMHAGEKELLNPRDAAHACRAEASQLRAAVALAEAAAAARAPPPASTFVPAYATGQPTGKGAPPVPEAGSEIPDFTAGQPGIFT